MPIANNIGGGGVTCHSCGSLMVLRSGKFGNFLGCSSFPTCRVTYPYTEGIEIKRLDDVKASPFQKAIFNQTLTDDNFMVNALAGSGKTTTAIEFAIRAREQDKLQSILFLAFNRTIVEELKTKLPPDIVARTCHSMGRSICKDYIGKFILDTSGSKLKSIVDRLITYDSYKEIGIYTLSYQLAVKDDKQDVLWQGFIDFKSSFKELFVLARLNLVYPEDSRSVMSIIRHYGIDFDSLDSEAVSLYPQAYKAAVENTDLLDFTDFLHLPFHYNWISKSRFDTIIVDEAQDLSGAMRDVAVRSMKPDGRFIGVGDPRQAISGFAGAMTDSFFSTKSLMDADELTLPICYRCPDIHLELARVIVPEIRTRDNAPVGELQFMTTQEAVENMMPGDLVICRLNSPLVDLAFTCLKNRKAFYIDGASLGKGLETLIKRVETQAGGLNSLSAFQTSLDSYCEKKCESWRQKNDMIAIADLLDKKTCLEIIMRFDGITSVKDMLSALYELFTSQDESIKGSSVHKAKGGEADNVFILDGELMPFYRAKMYWEREQEMNLLYVALTRAKKKMVFINSVPKPITDKFYSLVKDETVEETTQDNTLLGLPVELVDSPDEEDPPIVLGSY